MITEVKIETRKSKNDKEYSVLVIVWKNGYKSEFFINNEQKFCIELNMK